MAWWSEETVIDVEYQVETVEFVDVTLEPSAFSSTPDPRSFPVEMALIPDGNVLNRDVDFVTATWFVDDSVVPPEYGARVRVGLAGSDPTPAIEIVQGRYRIYTRVTASDEKPVKWHGYASFTQQHGTASSPLGSSVSGDVVGSAPGPLEVVGIGLVPIVGSPTDGQVLAYNVSTHELDWVAQSGGGTLPDPVTLVHGGTGATSAAAARTALGLDTAAQQPASAFQPADSDLTAIAALTTTSYGRAFLALADAAGARTALVLGTAAQNNAGDFDAAGLAAAAQAASQPVDSDLTAIAALTTTSFGRSLLTAASAAALKTTLAIAESDVTNLTTDLAAKALAARLVSAGAGLSGGGDLTADRTISMPNVGTAGTVGDATHYAIITTDAQGRISGMTAQASPAGADKLGLTITAVKTANYTAGANEFVPADLATTGSFTDTFPTAPADGTLHATKIIAISGSRTLTLQLGGSDVFNVAGGVQTGSLSLLNQAGLWQYKASSAIWYTIATDIPLSQADLRYQPLDSDLTAIAALTTTSFGRAFLALADAAATRTAIGTVIGTDVEAHDSDLTTIAAIAPANDDVIQRKAGAWTNRTMAQVKTDLVLVKADVGLGNVDNTSNATERAATRTLSNARITKRVVVVNAPGATPSINSDNNDIARFTGLAAAITSMTTNLTGTPVDGDSMVVEFIDNGTARAITWGTSFASTTVTLPTTTVISTRLRCAFMWNTTTTKWDLVGVA